VFGPEDTLFELLVSFGLLFVFRRVFLVIRSQNPDPPAKSAGKVGHPQDLLLD